MRPNMGEPGAVREGENVRPDPTTRLLGPGDSVGVGREGGGGEVTRGTSKWLGIQTINRGAGQKAGRRVCVGV